MWNRISVGALLLPMVVFSGLAAGEVQAKDEIDVLAYSIDTTVIPDGLAATVTLAAKTRRPLKKMRLRLASGLELLSCRLNREGQKREKDIPFKRNGWDLELDFGRSGTPKNNFALVFEIRGRPYNKLSRERGGFVRTNVCAEHAYIRSQYAWYPRVPGDPATCRTTIRARKDWLARTAGTLVERVEGRELTTWTFALEKPARDVGLVAGPYVTVKRHREGAVDDGGMVLDALVFAGHEKGGEALLEVAAKAIDFYSSLYGAVEGRGFTLVEMPEPFGAGSGYSEIGYMFIGSGAFEKGGSAAWAEALVAHEIAHTWWAQEVKN